MSSDRRSSGEELGCGAILGGGPSGADEEVNSLTWESVPEGSLRNGIAAHAKSMRSSNSDTGIVGFRESGRIGPESFPLLHFVNGSGTSSA